MAESPSSHIAFSQAWLIDFADGRDIETCRVTIALPASPIAAAHEVSQEGDQRKPEVLLRRLTATYAGLCASGTGSGS